MHKGMHKKRKKYKIRPLVSLGWRYYYPVHLRPINLVFSEGSDISSEVSFHLDAFSGYLVRT